MPPIIPHVQLPMFDDIEIALTNGTFTYVDPIDADLADFKWQIGRRDHLFRTIWVGPQRDRICYSVYLHRIILERMLDRKLTRYELTDHIDCDPLNNRRSNLRLATPAQNQQNCLFKNSKSGYKGVVPSKRRFTAQITVNRQVICLGRFADPIDAARAYDKAAIEHFGSFARTNVMLGLLPPLDATDTH